MPFNIVIDHATTAHNSDQSSVSSDEEDSSGTGVHVSPRSAADSQEYTDQIEEQEGSWEFPNEIGPSDSASRPRTSNQQRPIVPAPQPEHARRSSYRQHIVDNRAHQSSRTHRSPPSEPAESVDSHEDWQGYARGPPQQYPNRPYAAHYAPSGYPAPHPYQTYPPQSVVPTGQQQIVPFGYPPYPSGAPAPTPPYFGHGHHVNHGHHPGMGHEMVPHAPHPYYPYVQQGFPMPMSPPAVYQMYPTPPPVAAAAVPATASTPAPTAARTPPPPAPLPDTSKYDENLARLEKLLLDQKAEQESKETALVQAAKDAAARAEADKLKADEIAKASAAAAAAAKLEAENEYKAAAAKAAAKAEAEKKKADEIAAASAAAAAAAKLEYENEMKAAAAAAAAQAEADKKRADEIATSSAAAVEAALAEKSATPAKEPDKPIKFKDAIGRRFSFPFDLCREWRGMEYLIKEAFLHVEEYGPHVANGEYDLVGPHDEIIMKPVWEIVVKPGWEISMHMWPLPEPELPPEPPIMVPEGVPPPPPPAPLAPGSKTIDATTKRPPKKPTPFFLWSSSKPKKKTAKAKQK